MKRVIAILACLLMAGAVLAQKSTKDPGSRYWRIAFDCGNEGGVCGDGNVPIGKVFAAWAVRVRLDPMFFDVPGHYDADIEIGEQQWRVVKHRIELPNGKATIRYTIHELVKEKQ